MKPGMTIAPEQSTTSASEAETLGAIWAIFFPSMRMSAFSKSPTFASRLRTTPPRSRMRRLLASPVKFWASGAAAARAGESCALPHDAPARPAAPAVRKSRRDRRPGLGDSGESAWLPIGADVHEEVVDTAGLPDQREKEAMWAFTIAAPRRLSRTT